jgi:hypothetical protein
MEAIVTVYVLSLLVASGVLMYSLLTAEKPKSSSIARNRRVEHFSKLKRFHFFKKLS